MEDRTSRTPCPWQCEEYAVTATAAFFTFVKNARPITNRFYRKKFLSEFSAGMYQ
jgi:hypothetical protein